MPFQVKIQNLGKLADAEIRIGNFTVFAGKNNTGKSFVSKALYSLFGAMNANHLEVSVAQRIRVLDRTLRRMNREEGFESDALIAMIAQIENLQKIIKPTSGNMDEFDFIEQTAPKIYEILDLIQNTFLSLQKDAGSFLESAVSANDSGEPVYNSIFNYNEVEAVKQGINELLDLKNWKTEDFIGNGLEHEINQNLIDNFQVTHLFDLCRYGSETIKFDIAEIGNITIHSNVEFSINRVGLHKLQEYSSVLYLESPVFWRLRDALENIRNTHSVLWMGRERLTGVPKYVYDIYDKLRERYKGDPICPDILERLTGKEVLGGKIAVGEQGNLFFQEEGTNYSLPLDRAAMGIANLGMLALLIERNLLDKNTFLFIDEPEAHLHPAWQVEMAESLFALAKAGVHVVIATHSAEILKWLEVHIKDNPEAEKITALNHFRPDGKVTSNSAPFQERLDAVQEELAGPYYKLYYKGL
ncbi:MAG: AAA family ATPase [Gammaproteobacteria bacterium]